MPFADTDLAAILGAALAPLLQTGTLHRSLRIDDGAGGSTLTSADYPISAEPLEWSEQSRPDGAVPTASASCRVLRAGLPVPIAIDDRLTLQNRLWRVTGSRLDGAGVAFALTLVPA